MASGAVYTISIYVKAGEDNTVGLSIADSNFGAGGVVATADLGALTTSNVFNATSSLTSVGNGWYRFVVTSTTTLSTTGTPRCYVYNPTTGDGYSGIYIWGAQIEQGSFPTSYIATSGSSATRNADSAEMTGTNFSSWYRQDEGTVYADWVIKDTTSETDASHNIVSFLKTSSTERMSLRIGFSGFRRGRYFALDAGSTFEYSLNGASDESTSGKVVLAFSQNEDFVASEDGASVISDATGNISDFNLDRMHIGRLSTPIEYLNGHLRKLAFYPKRLPNATLQALTEE